MSPLSRRQARPRPGPNEQGLQGACEAALSLTGEQPGSKKPRRPPTTVNYEAPLTLAVGGVTAAPTDVHRERNDQVLAMGPGGRPGTSSTRPASWSAPPAHAGLCDSYSPGSRTGRGARSKDARWAPRYSATASCPIRPMGRLSCSIVAGWRSRWCPENFHPSLGDAVLEGWPAGNSTLSGPLASALFSWLLMMEVVLLHRAQRLPSKLRLCAQFNIACSSVSRAAYVREGGAD